MRSGGAAWPEARPERPAPRASRCAPVRRARLRRRRSIAPAGASARDESSSGASRRGPASIAEAGAASAPVPVTSAAGHPVGVISASSHGVSDRLRSALATMRRADSPPRRIAAGGLPQGRRRLGWRARCWLARAGPAGGIVEGRRLDVDPDRAGRGLHQARAPTGSQAARRPEVPPSIVILSLCHVAVERAGYRGCQPGRLVPTQPRRPWRDPETHRRTPHEGLDRSHRRSRLRPSQ